MKAITTGYWQWGLNNLGFTTNKWFSPLNYYKKYLSPLETKQGPSSCWGWEKPKLSFFLFFICDIYRSICFWKDEPTQQERCIWMLVADKSFDILQKARAGENFLADLPSICARVSEFTPARHVRRKILCSITCNTDLPVQWHISSHIWRKILRATK